MYSEENDEAETRWTTDFRGANKPPLCQNLGELDMLLKSPHTIIFSSASGVNSSKKLTISLSLFVA